MILIGNQRGGGRDLALHLLKEENDHVRVHQIRGFVAYDLEGAFKEAYAISRGTRCKQFLFSLSLNPPKDAEVPTEDFESAIERVERKLGLTGQPRAIVFHEKEGRRHAHAVWSRIKADEMKAVQMSYSGEKLLDVSRDLHREHGWKMPRGLVERSERDPRNFTLDEWQQAKRNGVDPRDIKTHIQDAWAMSDSKPALKRALGERGYRLAKGDKRGYVAIDYRGEVYSLPKYADVKTKAVRERLGDPTDLSTVDEAQAAWASDMLRKAQDWQRELDQRRAEERKAFAAKREDLVTRQRAERAAQDMALRARQLAEARERQERFRSGFKGLWDRLRGEHARVKQQNLREAAVAAERDQAERDKLVFAHLQQRREIVKTQAQERDRYHETARDLDADRQTFSKAATGDAKQVTQTAKKPPPPRGPSKVAKAAPRPPSRNEPPKPSEPSKLKEDWKAAAPPQPESPVLSDKDKRLEAFKARRRDDAERQSVRRSPSLDR